MELRDFVALAWKRRWYVLFMVALTVGLGAAFAATKQKKYESTATIAMTPNISTGQGFVDPNALSALIRTYQQTAQSEFNIRKAEELAHGRLPGTVSTSSEAGAGILRITGTAATPTGAQTTAWFPTLAFMNSLRKNKLLVAQLVDRPGKPVSPVQPRPPLIIGVALILGLGAGLLLAFALEQFRRRVETPQDLQDLTPAPVIGRLPRQRSLQRGEARPVWEVPKMAILQESFRSLRTNIEFLTEGNHTAIQVTSATASQGKSTVVANLGIALAQIGIETIVLDADLRRPVQHRIFGLENSRGLSTLMAIPGSKVRPLATHYPHLSVVPSGPVPPNSTEMLHVRFHAVLEEIRSTGALVLIDSPPLLPVSDARLIAPHADGVIVVVAAGASKPGTLRSAFEKLQFAEARVLGVVLNQSGEDSDGGGEYDYYVYGEEPLKGSTQTGSSRAAIPQ
jgi:capsular exopolysaccharide synthesis family protein